MVAFSSKAAAASCLLALSGAAAQNITSDAHFYGQSPKVLPSRESLPLSMSKSYS